MIRRNMTKTGGLLAMMLVLAACGALSEALTDAQNRLILTDVTGETSSTTGTGEGSGDGDTDKAGPPPECRGNPIKENCANDAKTYCAEYLPPAEEEAPPEPGSKSFEDRRDHRRELHQCLKEHLESLSASCQEAVNSAPEPLGGDRFAPPPRRPEGGPGEGHGKGPGPGQGRPNCSCGGKSPLKECVADARTLCEAELPVPGEPDGFTKEERREKVRTIVACLEAQLESVSDACKSAIEALPPRR